MCIITVLHNMHICWFNRFLQNECRQTRLQLQASTGLGAPGFHRAGRRKNIVLQTWLRLAGSSLHCTVLHCVALRWKGPLSRLGSSVILGFGARVILGVFQEVGVDGKEAMS